ncbi:uncharacterized protein [Typha angustifolia]|uniref:uncharacterized protein n=1 Tax=Typha angustifolia TaxID=59011 RepID=UPI003C2CD19E
MEVEGIQKHRCKYCKKRFPSGRSLGGHMRSHLHMASSSSDVEETSESTRGLVGTGTGYGLREKPKKTWRLSDSGKEPWEKQCGECGKEFLSWKALFGHMKCHSEKVEAKEQNREQEGSLSIGAATLMVPRKRRRSRWPAPIATSSSSVSEYEEEEEGAMSLMMLSRDVGCWGGFYPIGESSDKNSVVLEGKSLKKVESDISDDGVVADEEFKKPKSYPFDTQEFEQSDEESRKDHSMKDLNCAAKRVDGYWHDASDCDLDKASEKRSRFECTTCNKTFHSYQALGGHRASHKRIKGCLLSRTNASENSVETDASFDQRSTDGMVEASYELPKKINRHECLICGKFFASGQALGGHKRSHLAASSNSRGDVEPDLLDLNFPAPADGGSVSTKENSEVKSWWIASNLQHEPLLGMISN